jgi:hypothetical protein
MDLLGVLCVLTFNMMGIKFWLLCDALADWSISSCWMKTIPHGRRPCQGVMRSFTWLDVRM